MNRAHRRWLQITGWFRTRPFTTALLVLTAVVVPGYVQLQNAVNDAQAASADARAAAEALERNAAEDAAREDRQREVNCENRNGTNDGIRSAFTAMFDTLDLLLPDTSEAQDFVADLRRDVFAKLDPVVVDVDCNRDGVLDSEDYPP